MVVSGQYTKFQTLCPCNARISSGSFVSYLHNSLDCEFLACGKTEEEVLSKASQHVQGVHKMKGYSLDLYQLHAQPSVKDTGGYGDAQETISEDCSACYEAYLTAPTHGQQMASSDCWRSLPMPE